MKVNYYEDSWEVKYIWATRARTHRDDSEPGSSNTLRWHGAKCDIGHAE